MRELIDPFHHGQTGPRHHVKPAAAGWSPDHRAFKAEDIQRDVPSPDLLEQVSKFIARGFAERGMPEQPDARRLECGEYVGRLGAQQRQAAATAAAGLQP